MTSRLQYRRLLALAFLVFSAFAGLGLRLVDLQVRQHGKFLDESEDDTRRLYLRASKRGEIRDIRGNLLAGTILVKTVCGDPVLVRPHRAEVARTIAPLLEMSEAEVFNRLEPRIWLDSEGRLKTNRYAVLKRKVTVETWVEIHAAMQQVPVGVDVTKLPRRARIYYDGLRNRGVFIDPLDDQLRIYPNQTLAAHVLGYVGASLGESPKGKIDELDGRDGIELALNSALKGVVGWRSTEIGRRGELVRFREQDVEAHPGRNVVLTLDAGVQHIVESEMAVAVEKHTPISISVVVVRPRTGAIVALANWPTFNPNDLSGARLDWLRNRAITDLAEPGSTFKIVVVSGALNDGTVTLEDQFDCEHGVFRFAGFLLHDDHEGYGLLSVEEIITHSSNIGAAKIGIRMGPDRLYHYIRSFGFGSKTGSPLLGEQPGIVWPPRKWSKLSISRIPMGHEVAVTPLQMVMAMSAIANEGRLMRPLLVDRLVDERGQVVFQQYPQPVRQVVSERAAAMMVAALRTVVSTNGTGRKARLDHYTVAGKTGTARKAVGGQYRRDKHFSSFIGFFPSFEPELCIGVFLDEPKHGYYGGEAAAPVFRAIAERTAKYLGIPPDVEPAESLPLEAARPVKVAAMHRAATR